MKRRFTSRPAPAMSAFTAVVGVFMLLFSILFFSQAKAPTAAFGFFLFVWVLALLGIIIYHVANATRSGGVPTEIIEGEDDGSVQKTSAESLKELEILRNQKLITDTEFENKRQEILKRL
jgi:hypothetical protein